MCGFLGHVLRACAQDLGLINVDLWVDSDEKDQDLDPVQDQKLYQIEDQGQHLF